MSLGTFSTFYFGLQITKDNNLLNFDEGGGELTAELNIGGYTHTTILDELERALNAAGGFTYTATMNRTNRKVTIAAGSTFTLYTQTGSQVANSPWQLLGYSQLANHTGTNTYQSEAGAGYEYLPQFILQDHVDTMNWVQAAEASVNKSARGDIEVVTFGNESFLQCNIKYITNITQDGSVIHTNGSGVSDVVFFLNYVIQKAPIEYIKDVAQRDTFEPVLLESTPDNSKGVGFKLKELYDQGLPGYFETGALKFRVYNP